MKKQIQIHLDKAIQKRSSLIKPPYNTAFRLLNGFSEGIPSLVIEIFGRTVIFHDYGSNEDLNENASKPIADTEEKTDISTDAEVSDSLEETVVIPGPDSPDDKETESKSDLILEMAIEIVKEQLPWVLSGVLKKRRSQVPEERSGTRLFGSEICSRIEENGVLYSVNLLMNRDSSFYLDTKLLRKWAKENLGGKSVLNTFAYTGSLGVACLAGGSKKVIQLDLHRKFLNVAMRSAKLNGKEVKESDYQTCDFWSRINQYKKSKKMFDCVILDPPVYSKTRKGTIDLANNYEKLINKVRPIINDGGYLITISNALFQRGDDHTSVLDKLCADGYLKIEQRIDVPDDCLGNAATIKQFLPADPSPYNHSTKITVLSVKRKSPAV
ncbi:SAM-dependent methyltransferase [bacterium]|jgi:23S rRNA (cytosine1962-C5)-methyltransferase|nr:SAM-dependent methyltransferase [bacterium]